MTHVLFQHGVTFQPNGQINPNGISSELNDRLEGALQQIETVSRQLYSVQAQVRDQTDRFWVRLMCQPSITIPRDYYLCCWFVVTWSGPFQKDSSKVNFQNGTLIGQQVNTTYHTLTLRYPYKSTDIDSFETYSFPYIPISPINSWVGFGSNYGICGIWYATKNHVNQPRAIKKLFF